MTEPNDLTDRLAFATAIATAAGRRLLALRRSARWPDARMLGDVGDQAADGYLQGALFGRYARDAVLSEETKDDRERLDHQVAWIVDPLDGTKEYGGGRHDWGVHVGLAVAGRPVLGVVALPAIGRVLAAGIAPDGQESLTVSCGDGDDGEGGDGSGDDGAGDAWPQAPAPDAGAAGDRVLRLAASRSHTPEWMQRFAHGMGDAELVPCGSVGFKVAMLLFGKADVYVHKVGLKEWDTCAPEVVARAAGYAVCRFDGTDHRYNQPDARNNELVVCRPWLRERVLSVLADVGTD